MPEDPSFINGRLNVDDFVAARKTDIDKLEASLSSSGLNGKKRAFQSLPRVERRRAASHDPKRVPRKRGLRKKAVFENLRDNAKASKSRNRKITRSPTNDSTISRDITSIGGKVDFSQFPLTNVKYRNRQRDKIWLPTHIWHRKRAFMTNISDILVPMTATQKQYRRVYRSISHIDERSSLAWDTSFYSTLLAKSDNIFKVLAEYFPGSTEPLYKNGARIWQGVREQIGPVLIHWFGEDSAAIFCHPSIFDEIWDLLANTDHNLVLEDCRYAIGSIDLLGKKPANLLSEVIKPLAYSTEESQKTWNAYKSTQILPYRSAINVACRDPRLSGSASQSKIESTIDVAEPCVYSKILRSNSLASKLSQSEIDGIRNGSVERDLSKLAPIPITIMNLDDGRVRIVAPRDWILPLWLSIFKNRNVLLGGQQELRQLAFEKSLPWFPQDFPQILAGDRFNSSHAAVARAAYAKRPKSQRAHLDKELGDPFKLADLEMLKCAPGDIINIMVTAVERGVATPGARIFLRPADKNISDHAGRIEAAHFEDPDSLIGFVTSGGIALSSSKGHGIGVASNKVQQGEICIVKNVGSRYGFLALIEIANPTHCSF